MLNDEVIRGERVALTPLRLDNIYKHFEWNNDAELNKFDSESPLEPEPFWQFKQRFERMVLHPVEGERDFEIHVDDGELIGVAFISRIDAHNRNCVVGLTIGERRYWGQGLGRQTLELLLDYCFNQLNMHRVSAETFEHNDAWTNLVRNAGFVQEGEEREYLFREGSYWGKFLFGMLDREYQKRSKWTSAVPRARAS